MSNKVIIGVGVGAVVLLGIFLYGIKKYKASQATAAAATTEAAAHPSLFTLSNPKTALRLPSLLKPAPTA